MTETQTYGPQSKQSGIWVALFCLVAAFLYGAPAHAQTWRILAVRVSFPPENPDQSTTSGNGAFDLRALADARDSLAYPFDAPPHDRAYFEAHLQALANYYREVSNGRVDIRFDVYPRDPNGSYVLQTPLIDYGNGRTRQETAERITRLFRDGIAAADRAEPIDFSQYDAFAVFHAGLGGEASQALNDVPSAFISAKDLDDYADGPIAVDNGAFAVHSGMLLPEAISTDGRGGLNGTMARFFASQLGLPGLSDFENDLPAVGDWSLMDTGANNIVDADSLGLQPLRSDAGKTLIGFLPCRPMAWSRIRLGWMEPQVVTRNDTVRIVAPYVHDSSLPQAVKVPISATEYYLLENRISRRAIYHRTPHITLSDPNGVWLSTDDYDAQIPGSGILIWHIDDAVIDDSDDAKSINSNPDFEIAFAQYRRGISLEEADGLQDIGNISADRIVQNGIISFSTIEGGPLDPFYVGNNTHFAPDTTPNTNSNLHYPTGITIDVLSPPADTMTVAIRFSQQQDSWPVTGLQTRILYAPRATDLNGNGEQDILRDIATTATGAPIPGFHLDADFPPAVGDLTSAPGLEWIAGRGTTQYRWQNGALDSLTTAFVAASALSTAPVIAPFPTAPIDIWGWRDGRVQWGAWDAARAGGATLGAAVEALAVGDISGTGDNDIVAVTQPGEVDLVHASGHFEKLAAFDAPIVGAPAIADLDRDGRDDIVVVTSDGVLSILGPDGIAFKSDPVPGGAWSPPVLADLDNDGYVEALFGGDGKVWAFRFNGVLQTGGALAFPLKDRTGPIDAPPVLADLDNDGHTDILVGTRGGLIYGLTATGQAMPGFPLSAPGPIRTSPLLADLDNDGTLELVAFTDNGAIQLYHLPHVDPSYTGNKIAWGQLGGGPGNAGKLLQPPDAQPAESAGDLLPAKRAYVYPNPIRRGDRARIRFFLSTAATVTITVYNPLGEAVDHLGLNNPVPNTDNEIAWDVADYASGLYICRVEASDGTKKAVRFIKAAVIK